MEQDIGQHIGGHAIGATAGAVRLPLIDPATGERVGSVIECARPAEAVTAALRAHESGEWRSAAPADRAAVLGRIAKGIESRADDIARADTQTTGLPFHRSTRRHAEAAAGWFAHFAAKLAEDPLPLDALPGVSAHVLREPHGVVALFTPWNIPTMSAALKSAAALAMGNAVVLKPSELAPASALVLAQIATEAGLPAGQINVVQGRGNTVGAALAADPRVRAISFTGGSEGGAAVAAAAARNLCPVTLELGGKSAIILDADAPMPQALDAVMASAFANNGEACLASSRLLVHQKLMADLLPILAERIAAMPLADPFDADCIMGPLISSAHRDHTLERIGRGLAMGDRLLAGGTVPAEPTRGYWFRPALIVPAGNDSPCVQEEFFAPVLTIQSFASVGEAIALADSTRYGLALYVWSKDPEMIARAKRLDAGTICINSPFRRIPDAPFGGFRGSGFGREGGRASMAFFCAEKTVLESRYD